MFDVTNPASFESLDTWIKEIDKYSGGIQNMVLVANKVSWSKKTSMFDLNYYSQTGAHLNTFSNCFYFSCCIIDFNSIQFCLFIHTQYKYNVNIGSNRDFNRTLVVTTWFIIHMLRIRTYHVVVEFTRGQLDTYNHCFRFKQNSSVVI